MNTDNRRLFRTFGQRWELIGLVLILCLSIPAIIWLPEKMVQQVYGGDKTLNSANNYAKLVDDYRKTIVQAIGGLLLFGTFYVGFRQLKFTGEELNDHRLYSTLSLKGYSKVPPLSVERRGAEF